MYLSPASGKTGSWVGVKGSDWATGTEVEIFIDTQDADHLMTKAMPGYLGRIRAYFMMSATTLGPHDIIAVQDGTTKTATFILTATEPLDERTQQKLDNLESLIAALPAVPLQG